MKWMNHDYEMIYIYIALVDDITNKSVSVHI